MSAVLDMGALTLNSEEAREAADLVFETLFVKPQTLQDIHDVQVGVEMDKYIPILGQFGLVGKISVGDCTTNAAGQIPLSQKQWLPKLISYRLTHCQEQVPDLLKFWKKSRVAKNTWEEVNNEYLAFVNDRAIDATMESVLRITSFGDITASPVGDALGSEQLTAGTDKAFFNMLDGLWKQIFTDQAGAALIYRHTLSANAQATKAQQLALGATDAIDAMRAMYENISAEAFADGELVYEMTRTMHNNWVAFLEDKSLAFTLQQAEVGKVANWTYRGIPIKIRYDWDRNIQAYQDLGLTYFLPHRIILTKLTNMPIGTSDEESIKALTSLYDGVTRKHYIDAAYKVDIKILQESQMAVAY